MASADQLGLNKSWELSLYELHRLSQDAITDNTEIAVSPRSLHSELMCPICLDMLKKTMTTKECLHRFCSDCIITALRSGNKVIISPSFASFSICLGSRFHFVSALDIFSWNQMLSICPLLLPLKIVQFYHSQECPTCRKKLVSKRSLRPDPNFDLLISKIYPSRDEYEAHQERALAKLNKSHSQAALVNSITEGIKLQSQNRPQRARKAPNEPEGGNDTATTTPYNNNSNSVATTPVSNVVATGNSAECSATAASGSNFGTNSAVVNNPVEAPTILANNTNSQNSNSKIFGELCMPNTLFIGFPCFIGIGAVNKNDTGNLVDHFQNLFNLFN